MGPATVRALDACKLERLDDWRACSRIFIRSCTEFDHVASFMRNASVAKELVHKEQVLLPQELRGESRE